MVGVAQLVEHRVVAPVVVGSSPITHPILKKRRRPADRRLSYSSKISGRSFLYPCKAFEYFCRIMKVTVPNCTICEALKKRV